MADDIIKPEDIQDGEIEAIVEMANEEEPESIDYASLAYNMSLVITTVQEIDKKLYSQTEQDKIGKATTQAIKLLCFSMDELHKEHFPKKLKR